MRMFYPLLRPLIFRIDAESAHKLSLTALGLMPKQLSFSDQILKTSVAGLDFPNPVGLAPGYDKNAEIAASAFGLGFGFVELGTVTPQPQAGNAKPRLFRLVEDRAVINRMGFNNDGMEKVAARLSKLDRSRLPGQLGINIGANKDSGDRISDYVAAVQQLGPLADYVTVNISSPNTPGLRALQDKAALDDLLGRVVAAAPDGKPVFLKVAPDLEPADVTDICQSVLEHSVAALIVSNTTITRPPLKSHHREESGGLSGAPLRDLAHQRLIDFRRASGGKIPLIGVGGIANADDAYARIRAGASLVQLYSALVYEGPGLADTINRGLAKRLKHDGFLSVTDAVGVDVPV